jgi:acyl dehydratase
MFDAVIGQPVHQRYFEDYTPGASETHGAEPVLESDIIGFATRFDPQSIHTDAGTAAFGPFNGLIASGWHTASVVMKIMVDSYLNENASLGGIGVDQLRWPAPVRPGDTLSATFSVAEARRSRSKPDRGIVRTDIKAHQQDGIEVLRMTTISILRARQTDF